LITNVKYISLMLESSEVVFNIVYGFDAEGVGMPSEEGERLAAALGCML